MRFSTKPPCIPVPAGSQPCGDVQTETCTASGGGTAGSVGHVTPVDLQKDIKKEEPGDDDYLCGGPSCSVGDIAVVDQQKHVKKEEPEDEAYLCGGTSSSMKHVAQQKKQFQRRNLKKEESEDEDYLCTMEMDDAQLQVFSCSWCSVSYTSQIYLHVHIKKCHFEEYERLLESGEIKSENFIPTRSSSIQDCPLDAGLLQLCPWRQLLGDKLGFPRYQGEESQSPFLFRPYTRSCCMLEELQDTVTQWQGTQLEMWWAAQILECLLALSLLLHEGFEVQLLHFVQVEERLVLGLVENGEGLEFQQMVWLPWWRLSLPGSQVLAPL
ncbi:hypothetical protein PDJAM_G00101790 [Pangasius djambal]|uniref:Uncharacterized protein n=1 Tax=Pangasius djambal TaxID=1691987 RepID=A0ACC5Z8Z5_9TELE|nr:hypothetical protein [Pangasius djambal]